MRVESGREIGREEQKRERRMEGTRASERERERKRANEQERRQKRVPERETQNKRKRHRRSERDSEGKKGRPVIQGRPSKEPSTLNPPFLDYSNPRKAIQGWPAYTPFKLSTEI